MFDRLLWILLVGLCAAQDNNTTTPASGDSSNTTTAAATNPASTTTASVTAAPLNTTTVPPTTTKAAPLNTTAPPPATKSAPETTVSPTPMNITTVSIAAGESQDIASDLEFALAGLCGAANESHVLHTLSISFPTILMMSQESGISEICGTGAATKECLCVAPQTLDPTCNVVVAPEGDCTGIYKQATNSSLRRQLQVAKTKVSVTAKMTVKPGSDAAKKAADFVQLTPANLVAKLQSANKAVAQALAQGGLPTGFPVMSGGTAVTAADVTGEPGLSFNQFKTKYADSITAASAATDALTADDVQVTEVTAAPSSTSGATGLFIAGIAFAGSFLMF